MNNIGYASVSAMDAWRDAGFELPGNDDETVELGYRVHRRFGIGGMDTSPTAFVPLINEVKSALGSGLSSRL